MARIRTIKPEFWTDEKIIQLSPFARLLFLGMWNYADDHGGIESSEPQLKMRILPADPVDVHDLLKELLAHGLLIEYSVNDARYYHIKNFPKHQKINRPSNPRVPPYPSLNHHGGLTEDSPREGKGSGSGREGKGKEVDLDLERKGREGADPALPSPPSEGGGAASNPHGDNGNGQGAGEEIGAALPDFAVADINRLPEGPRTTILILMSDFRRGTIPRDEAVAMAERLKVPQQSIAVLFPVAV